MNQFHNTLNENGFIIIFNDIHNETKSHYRT